VLYGHEGKAAITRRIRIKRRIKRIGQLFFFNSQLDYAARATFSIEGTMAKGPVGPKY
jgi:hypothetical protein